METGRAGSSGRASGWPSPRSCSTSRRRGRRSERRREPRILKLRLTVCGLSAVIKGSERKGQVELLPDLGTLSDEGLKQLIEDLQAEEQQVSYRRRVLH